MDKQKFKTNLEALCQWHGKQINPLVLAAYAEVLRDLSNEEFERACRYAIANSQFMPTAIELKEAVRGSEDSLMHSEWSKAIDAASRGKKLAESELGEKACYAIHKMGGLYLLGTMSDREWKKKEFASLYKEALKLQATQSLPSLPPTKTEPIALLPEVSEEEARSNLKKIAELRGKINGKNQINNDSRKSFEKSRNKFMRIFGNAKGQGY